LIEIRRWRIGCSSATPTLR